MLDTVYHEITAEEFGRLASMKPEDRNEELYNRCPSVIKWGYGLYGKGLQEKDGKHYIYYVCGSSCD